MHPLVHIISSSIGIVLLSIFESPNLYTFLLWLGIGIITTIIIDFDHFLIAALKGKKKVVLNILSNPLVSLRRIKDLRKKIYFHGFGIIRLFTHGVEIILMFVLFSAFIPSLTVSMLISTIIHWGLDLSEIIVYPERR